MQMALDALIWWSILFLVGLAAFPLVSRICRGLADKGYSIAKLVGLLLLAYFSWILSSTHLVKFGPLNVGISLVLLIGLSAFLGIRYFRRVEIPVKSILLVEGLFSAGFILFLLFIMQKPDIYFAFTEDFMDFAFLKSILRTDYFPPVDPWLAGHSLPYYYGGQLVVADLTTVSRIPAGISYNLAIAMVFALTIAAAYGLGYNLTRRHAYGFLAAVLVGVAGYVSGAGDLVSYFANKGPEGAGFVSWVQNYDLAAQVIPHTGNSYPYYSFLQGELHAHTISIPFQLMFIGLVLAIFKGPAAGQVSRFDRFIEVGILAVALGFFFFMNSWEYPAYLVFVLLAAFLLKLKLSKKALLSLVALSLLLYLPYHISSGLGGANGIGFVVERTYLVHFAELFALVLVPIAGFFFVLARERLRGRSIRGLHKFAFAALVLVSLALTALAFLLPFQLLIILVPLIFLGVFLAWRTPSPSEPDFVLVVMLTGFLVVLGCEILFVDDALSAPFDRFNTILKFYQQVWVFLAVGAAFAIYYLFQRVRGYSRTAWAAVVPLLIAASLLQPAFLTASWINKGDDGTFGVSSGTLDGLSYVKILDKGAYEAISWIDDNIEGRPVLLEAPGGTYSFGSCISTMTGLPTVIGWVTHEIMWQGSWDGVAGRDTEVDTIYTTDDMDKAVELLKKYSVEYIYVGTAERARYSEGLDKFDADANFLPVFQRDGVSIYRFKS